MGRGDSPQRYYGFQLRSCTHSQLDCSFQCSPWYHLRLRISIYLTTMEWHITVSWHQTPLHHSLPPTSKWISRKIPQKLEVSFACTPYRPSLDIRTAIGAVGDPNIAQGRHRMLLSWVSIWCPLTVPGQFLPRHGTSTDTHTHLHNLQDQVRSLVPIPTTQHRTPSHSLSRNLQQTKFVFIRQDAHKTPLQRWMS